MNYKISDISKILKIPSSTLRYYDNEGLLPNLKKDSFGNRIFQENDLSWINTINCLKKTGMKIKEIKKFIELVLKGDSTINQRLDLIKNQKNEILKQIEDNKKTLEYLEYKTEFYEIAKKLGSVELAKLQKEFDFSSYKNDLKKSDN